MADVELNLEAPDYNPNFFPMGFKSSPCSWWALGLGFAYPLTRQVMSVTALQVMLERGDTLDFFPIKGTWYARSVCSLEGSFRIYTRGTDITAHVCCLLSARAAVRDGRVVFPLKLTTPTSLHKAAREIASWIAYHIHNADHNDDVFKTIAHPGQMEHTDAFAVC